MVARMRPRRRLLAALVAAAGILALAVVAARGWLASHSPEILAMKPCPDRPNCVSSLDSDPRHAIAPLTFEAPPSRAAEAALRALARLPRTRVTVLSEAPLHATAACRSLVFGFVDDLELRMAADGSRIDVRSASRVGYSDLGVNRKRVERLRELFAEELGR